MSFQLDTSGEVLPFARYDPQWNAEPAAYRWADLSPFAQGYVEALLGAWCERFNARAVAIGTPERRTQTHFSDLAPETLARIMDDCEQYSRFDPCRQDYVRDGERFYHLRQTEHFPYGYPPLTPHLGDDGKVYLREGAR